MTLARPAPDRAPVDRRGCPILVGRSRPAQRIVGITVLGTVVVLSVVLLIEVDTNGTLVAEAGGWPAPLGITLVADRFAAVLLVVAEVTLLAVLVYAIGEPGAERNHVGFQSVYLVLAAGVAASFLTGDLFNLFVAFEMMLTASYVLLTLGGRLEQVRSGMTYIVISLIASTLFVTALALLYSATGTVNMADLANRIGELPPGVRSAMRRPARGRLRHQGRDLPALLLASRQLPHGAIADHRGLRRPPHQGRRLRDRSDPARSCSPRTPGRPRCCSCSPQRRCSSASSARSRKDDIRRILCFTIISQIGYMIMGLAFFTVAGIAAVVFSIIHHIVVKTSLFLVGGLVEHASGSNRLSRIGGMVRTTPFLAAMFILSALSLAGIPPLSGFISKFALIKAGFADGHDAVVAVSILVSLLTLFAMMRIWMGAFWSPPEDRVPAARIAPVSRGGGPALMVTPTAVLVLCSLAIAAAAGPIYSFCERTARDLLDRDSYIEKVLDR